MRIDSSPSNLEANVILSGRRLVLLVVALLPVAGCVKPTPLNAVKAEAIIRSQMFSTEPVYAEVPQKVWYGPKAPKDDYDGKAVSTLRKLEARGLVTVTEVNTPDGMTTFQAKATRAGFNVLGTMPSARGAVYRARICTKRLDGVKNFQPHPNDPLIGRADVVWHYDEPTPHYEAFDTKINKPLNKPFLSLASFYWNKGSWKFNIIVRKAEANS